MRRRLAVIASHFIQYQAPLWRELSKRPELDLTVYYLSDHGRRMGFDPEFGEKFQWDIPLDEGYRWELIPGAEGTSPGRLRQRLNLWPVQLVIRDTADVYLRSDYNSPGAIAFFYACLSRGVPVLYRGETTLEHENKQNARLKRIVLRPVFSRIVYALTIGKHSCNYVQSLGVPPDRIVFSPYNVDTAYWADAASRLSAERVRLRQSFGLPIDRPVVLFCGKVFETKRPLDLARAMCQLASRRPVSLLVAGTGDQLSEMQRIVKGCPGLISHFAGFVNQSKLPQVYAVADVVCLPSASETWGLVINEAMYFGCVPVVSARVGCAPDLVEGVGEIHPVGDIETIAASLDRVLDELPARKALVPSRIARYSLDHAVDGIVEAVLRATGSTGGQ